MVFFLSKACKLTSCLVVRPFEEPRMRDFRRGTDLRCARLPLDLNGRALLSRSFLLRRRRLFSWSFRRRNFGFLNLFFSRFPTFRRVCENFRVIHFLFLFLCEGLLLENVGVAGGDSLAVDHVLRKLGEPSVCSALFGLGSEPS